MSIINILPPLVADMIAAGEVVERPGSAVKELLENSIDAGAKNVTVEIRGGGATYIRVTDDGSGMSPEDAGLAFTCHATSKLGSADDLEAIGTLGFRGEALAAISAVSRVELLTRQRGNASGTRVVLEAGEILELSETGCPEGTTIIVRDLFYNTPARLKFMKSDRTEGLHCRDTAARCALGRPDVSIRCIRDGNDEFFTPGDGNALSAVYSILGRDAAAGMIECQSSDDSISVSGYISAPLNSKGNRSGQFFFCNGRYIKSAILISALEQGYKNLIMVGRFPSCALYLDMSLSSVDVNVHPAKTEVRFSDEKRVFDAVYYAALSALAGNGRNAGISGEAKNLTGSGAFNNGAKLPSNAVTLNNATKTSSNAVILNNATKTSSNNDASNNRAAKPPNPDFFRNMTAEQFRDSRNSGRAVGTPNRRSDAPIRDSSSDAERTAAHDAESAAVPSTESTSVLGTESESPHIIADQHSKDSALESALPYFRVVGETMGVYVIVEQGDELILIDKHAAHERIIFDELKLGDRRPMPQTLITPITFSPGESDAELLLENSEALEELGFIVENFGDSSVILRAVPSETDIGDAAAMLEEICQALKPGRRAADVMDELLSTVACKAAIKAGRNSEPKELEALARQVISGKVVYCPHGRPVSFRLTKKELDKEFRRI